MPDESMFATNQRPKRTKRVIFRTTPEEHEEIWRMAKAEGLSLSELIRHALDNLRKEQAARD